MRTARLLTGKGSGAVRGAWCCLGEGVTTGGAAVQGDAVWRGEVLSGVLSRRGGAVQAGVVLSITGSDIITFSPPPRE